MRSKRQSETLDAARRSGDDEREIDCREGVDKITVDLGGITNLPGNLTVKIVKISVCGPGLGVFRGATASFKASSKETEGEWPTTVCELSPESWSDI
jgi:dihydroxyacid dehydratase/phosphogluconate dehydratase